MRRREEFWRNQMDDLVFEWNIPSGLAGNDQISGRTGPALTELAAVQQYAGQKVSHIIETARTIQETQLADGQNLELDASGHSDFQEYTHKVEQILDGLALQLAVTIRQNDVEELLYRGILPIKFLFESVLKQEN